MRARPITDYRLLLLFVAVLLAMPARASQPVLRVLA